LIASPPGARAAGGEQWRVAAPGPGELKLLPPIWPRPPRGEIRCHHRLRREARGSERFAQESFESVDSSEKRTLFSTSEDDTSPVGCVRRVHGGEYQPSRRVGPLSDPESFHRRREVRTPRHPARKGISHLRQAGSRSRIRVLAIRSRFPGKEAIEARRAFRRFADFPHPGIQDGGPRRLQTCVPESPSLGGRPGFLIRPRLPWLSAARCGKFGRTACRRRVLR